MKSITTTWTGIRPLIMSNPQTVEIANPFAVNSRRINSLLKAARKKGDENRMAELADEQKRGDWEASAYWDSARTRVRRSFREMARACKLFGGIARNPEAQITDDTKKRLLKCEEKAAIRLSLMRAPITNARKANLLE